MKASYPTVFAIQDIRNMCADGDAFIDASRVKILLDAYDQNEAERYIAQQEASHLQERLISVSRELVASQREKRGLENQIAKLQSGEEKNGGE